MKRQISYNDIDDIVKSVQGGDLTRLDIICNFYDPLVKVIVRRLIEKNPKLITFKDDLYAEAKLAILDLIIRYDNSLSYFSYYLAQNLFFTLMSRCKQNIIKFPNTEISIEELVGSKEPLDKLDPFAKIENENLIKYLLTKLSQRQREAIYLYFFENKTQKEAASELNISQTSFSKRIKRSLEKMKQFLDNNN